MSNRATARECLHGGPPLDCETCIEIRLAGPIRTTHGNRKRTAG